MLLRLFGMESYFYPSNDSSQRARPEHRSRFGDYRFSAADSSADLRECARWVVILPDEQIVQKLFLGIGKHVLCTLPGGLNMRDTRKMFDAASYYPQLLAAALNPVRFIEPIVKLRNFIKLSAGQVYMVEAKMKSKVLKWLSKLRAQFVYLNSLYRRRAKSIGRRIIEWPCWVGKFERA